MKAKACFILLRMIFIVMIFSAFSLKAANIKIDKTPTITDINTTDKSAFINFDMSWENSWKVSESASNYDGAWVFVKYKEKDATEWKHAFLSTKTNEFKIEKENGVTPSYSMGNTDSKGVGVFIYRKKNGSGNINWDGVKLKWNYEENGINDINNVIIKVYAIEMVYVLKGAFKIGSGGNESSAFYTYPNTTTTFPITSEGTITVGQNNGNLCYAKYRYGDSYFGVIPTEFPKGYNAFWCMKYEITQEQYVDFLNSLTRQQQKPRVWSDISGEKVANRYVMSNTSTVLYRSGISCNATIGTTDPVNFYCDLNGNGIPNEKNDGQNISNTFMNWGDGAAYTDWAGLQPMTELQYEKACRGTLKPVSNEYAWGTVNRFIISSLVNAGMVNELPSNPEANVDTENPAAVQGPVRAGFFENPKATREQKGTSFYGIADLSGNLFERCVTIGNAVGASYKGTLGDGEIDQTGYATNVDWPKNYGNGAGFKGGSFYYGSGYARVSDREYAALGNDDRYCRNL